ncbi:spatacsin isoform X1 [Drosophila novamexicana]|uniref:spatacsin isoform X1 n=1 Tax=Drosophila novamexicana TaxID=47314 RepID=UPI0011E600F3|nr:spatacsin isoform X1 [Drosophila novamexicana]
MHTAQARNKIFKSWSGISEVSIIKEVATKGEHIDLCMEYWAGKRKIPVQEYRHYFYDVVQAYVQRLLSERLVCKADNVLHNVERDVKCFFYQYACECDDADLSEFVLDHLRCREPQLFEQEQPVLAYYWSLVQQLRECSDLLARHQALLPRVHIEALMTLPEQTLQLLIVELYFANGNEALLPELNKQLVWQHLVDTGRLDRLRRWCWCQEAAAGTADLRPLEQAYVRWKIEPLMYEYALEYLQQPCELLRNFFARAGYFFPAESSDMSTLLRRLCTMQCLEQHKELLSRQPLACHLLERGYHSLLLLDCVPVSALEQLAGENEPLLTLIIDLKTHDLMQREGFEMISKSVQSYLERTHHGAESLQEQPLLTFYDFLCHEPSVRALEGFLSSSNLRRVPYLNSLMARFEHHGTSSSTAVPSAHELFHKFKKVNFATLAAAAGQGELVSFSNARLSQRYASKAQLNYTHYLKQQRSAYAVYYFLMEQLQLYGQITRTQLFHACETATQLALQHAGDEELVTHCVACCEMLDFDTQTLRSFLHLQRLLPATGVSGGYTSQLQHWDQALVQQLLATPEQFPLESYQALMRLAARNVQGKWPSALLQHFAARNDWWQLLLLFQYFDLPLSELKQLLPHFKCGALGVHLLRALSYDCIHERQHKRAGNRRSDGQTNSSQETMTNSSHSSGLDANLQQLQRDAGQSLCSLLTHNAQQDLFALVLCSSNSLPEESIGSMARFMELMQSSAQHCSSINLLKHCVRQQMPVLAVLAATLSEHNRDWCWLLWLAVASGQWLQLLQAVTKSKEPQQQTELVWLVIRGAVSGGQLNALLHSFCIFQPHCKFVHLCHFLQLTAQQQDFSDATIVELRQFFCSWSQDAVQLPLCEPLARKQLLQRCIGLLLIQLEANFDCVMQQQKFLDCICRSDVGDICDLLDFCLLHRIFGVAAPWLRQLGINYEQLVRRDSAEYKRLVDALTEAKAYDQALQLASLLQLPLADIVYVKWLAELEAGQLRLHEEYEQEIAQHALPPAILVNFLLQAAAQQPESQLRRRYELLQSALGVIKQHHLFPNECFDRDQIEYDMVLCYLQLEQEQLTTVDIYHSEYFEQIMRQERGVLYKSFSELKELAGIDDLSIANKSQLTGEMEQRLDALLNMLLDEGDIVEALRLQELFEFRPNDLRFIVFAMALAEGMTSIANLSSKERQLLSDIEKSAFPKFNRLTLNQSPMTRCSSDLSGSCSTLEFEEIPSKEKQQTLETLLGIGSKLKHGVELGRRIVLSYRAAMYLDKEYLDVLRTKDVSVLLKSAAEEDCLQRLLVVSDIHISTRLTPHEIADSLALELTTCIVRPRFYIFHASQQPRNAPRNADLWGHNIDRDFHLFLELTPNTTLLGNCLLDYCDALKAYRRYQDNKPYEQSTAFERLSGIITLYGLPNSGSSSSNVPGSPGIPQVLSHKKQNQIYVELLIKAHLCFVHECSMEGIASVLERAKLLNGQLTKAKSWSLIVRLLIGIARYREMFYCFDALIENEQFESLLGQFDEDQKSGLRQAILGYLREYNPKNGKDLLRLAAHHFLMYKELAEMWSQEAQSILDRVRSAASSAAEPSKLKVSLELQQQLQQALEFFTHATENYLLDNKLILSQQSVARAELVAMQLDLCNKALEKRGGGAAGVGTSSSAPLCISVIGVQTREQFRELVNNHLRVPQTLILSRAYGHDVNWSEALLTQFVLLQRRSYLQDYRGHQRINDNVIEQVVKGYILHTQNNPSSAKHEESLAQLVELIRSVTLKYKLASILGLKGIVMSLINDSTVHYLRDTNFGRNEMHNVTNM